jgi:hypothetical protein
MIKPDGSEGNVIVEHTVITRNNGLHVLKSSSCGLKAKIDVRKEKNPGKLAENRIALNNFLSAR